MIYEFIATISAGFLLAGIALIIRHLAKIILKKQTPKWLIPLFAALGIFGFQIQQEYNWYSNTVNKLPKDTKVVKAIEKESWYRPWTFAKPQIVRFMAMSPTQKSVANDSIKSYHLYLFERRMSTKAISQSMDCVNGKVMDIQIQDGTNKQTVKIANPIWVDIDKNDELYKAVCQSS